MKVFLRGGAPPTRHEVRAHRSGSAWPPPKTPHSPKRNAPRRFVAVAFSSEAEATSGGGDGGARSPPGGGGGRRFRGFGAAGGGWRDWWTSSGLGLCGVSLLVDHLCDLQSASEPSRQDVVDGLLASLTAGELRGSAPKRVAIFVEPSPFTYVSGYNTRFRATIRELRKLGVEVLVVTTGAGRSLPGVPFPAGTEPPATFEGATVIGTPSFGCPLYWQVPLSLGVTPRVWDALRAFRPQLIHVTSPGVMPLAAWAFARVLDVPLLASYHTHVPAYLPSYRLSFLASPLWACIGALHWRAHATVAASASLASELVGAGASPRGATLTWRKAVDPDAFSPSWRCAATRAWLQGRGPQPAASAAPVVAARTAPPAASPSSSPAASPPLDDDSPLLLYVGRLGAEKNLSFLVPLLASAPPAARLAIVGDGPARADAEAAFAADPDAAKRVLFTGELRGAALSRAYASADAFLMPSETETLGFVVLEAMASGLPVVAVAAGGLPDIVTRPGANGFLYPPGDVASASARVNELCANAHLRRAVGAAATEEAAKWGWEAATQALLRSQYALAVALHAKGLHRGGLQLRGGGRRAGGGGESGGEGREGQEGEGGATAHRGTGARVQMAAHAALGGLKLAATLRPRAPAQRAGRAAVGRAAKRLRRALSSG